LIAFLLFTRMCDVSSQFGGFEWQQVLQRRYTTLLATLEAYEVALGCPGFPTPRADPHANALVVLIDEEHRRGQRELKALSARALRRLPYPPVFRDGALATAVATRVDLRRETVHSLIALPQDRTKVICIADGRVASITLTQGAVGLVDTSVDSGEVTALIGHPNFNLVLALFAAGLILFDPVSGQGEVCRFEVSSQEKVRCAAFSPNGSKLAVCSDVVDIFTVDLSKSFCKRAVSRDMKAPITAVAWVNGDTTVVVAYAQAGVGAIVVLNTLTRHPVPVEVRKELGVVNGLGVEPRKGRLIFVTKGGVTVICDMKRNYEHVCVFTHGCAVTALSSLYELFLVATEGGAIFAINLVELERMPDKLQSERKVS
jgi:hypothetical protein